MSNDLTEKESKVRVKEKQEIYNSTPLAAPPWNSLHREAILILI
jgi:hypothetical protein